MMNDIFEANKVLLPVDLLLSTMQVTADILEDPARHYSHKKEKENLPSGEPVFKILPSCLPQIRGRVKANQDIPINTPVGEVIGVIESYADYLHQERTNRDGHRLGFDLSVKRGLVINPMKHGNFAKYLRHSCKPNLDTKVWCTTEAVPRMTLVTTRDVKEGETLTINLKKQVSNKDLSITCDIYRCTCKLGQGIELLDGCSEVCSVSSSSEEDDPTPPPTPPEAQPDQPSNLRELGVPVGPYHLRSLVPHQMQPAQGPPTSSSSSESSCSSTSSNSSQHPKQKVERASLSPATKELRKNMAKELRERIQNELPRTNPIETQADEITPNRPPTPLSPPAQGSSRQFFEKERLKAKKRDEASQAMPPQSDLSGSAGTVANCEATYSASIAPPVIPTPQFPFTTETTSAASKKKVLKTRPSKTPAKKTQMPSKKTQPKKKQVSRSTPKSKQPTKKRSINPDLSCGICYEVFATKELLATHVKKRHPKRCFMCPHCYNTYCRASSLKRHIEEIHKTNSTTCLQCGLVSPSKRDHLKHLKEHQNQKKCPHHHCNYRSSDMQKLLDHIHDTHAPRTSKSSNRNNLESSSSTSSSSKSESD